MVRHIYKLVNDQKLKESFRISAEFKEEDFALTLLQKLNAWCATVDQVYIHKLAKQFDVSPSEYYTRLQDYFSKTPSGVEFRFKKDELLVNCVLENGMKVKYFSCNLQKVADYSSCVYSLLDTFYEEKNDLTNKFDAVRKERDEFEKSKINFETKLNEFIERKKTDDQELYNNFVLVVNEKKRRIQHLNELLEAFRRGRPTVNPQVEVKRKISKKNSARKNETVVKPELSESDSENGSDNYDTDDEKSKVLPEIHNKDLTNIVNKEVVEDLPGTSKQGSDELDAMDLFSDDSPPRHLLPKRVKSNVSPDRKLVLQPQSSKQDEDSKEKDVVAETMDYSPNVNFSTQELLDNI